jgi:hypothetical protein
VKEPSLNPMNPEPIGGAGETGETSADTTNGLPLPSGLLSVIAIVVAFGALMLRKN